MKKKQDLELTSGGGKASTFVSGVTCGYGLVTLFTPFTAIGAVMVLAGCSTLIEGW